MASDGAWRARRHLFVAGAEPLVTMNAMIKRHAAWGAYGGCERALALAAAAPRGA